MATFVIIGAGQAGAWLARTLRKQDDAARIVLIGNESAPPYERPPLSKEVLKGDAPPASATILSPQAAAEQDIELWLDETVEEIDRDARRVRCASGRETTYDKLFLATGSRVRTLPLPGIPQERVFYLRTLEEAERLHAAIQRSERVLVVGGGWIGLEVAAAARGLGKQASVVEMGPRLCARAVPPVVSDYLHGLHQRNGVDLRTGARAELGWDGERIQATLDDDSAPVQADIVVVAIGIEPNVELAAECGLDVDNGILVDAYGRTNDPAIFAAGDVTNHPDPATGARRRLESWDNAQNQAVAVARAAISPDEAYAETPWFWSDQYDVNLQILGLPPMDIEPVHRGDPQTGPCSWFFVRDGKIVSTVTANAPRDIRIVKKWTKQGSFPSADDLRDESLKLNKLPLE